MVEEEVDWKFTTCNAYLFIRENKIFQVLNSCVV
jgi:hypothetical protein